MAIKLGKLFFSIVLLIVLPISAASELKLDGFTDGAVGKYISFFHEERELSLEQAKSRFAMDGIKTSDSQSVTRGIGVSPVWMKLTVDNNSPIQKPFTCQWKPLGWITLMYG